MGLLLLQGASDLNPRELFANNEQGLWLDPSQMATMFTDSAGTTSVTAAGDPVGLILDQSRGGLSQIGADLVTNGTFAADSDWTKGANWTIGSGVATKTGGAANNLTQTIGSTAAAWYRISMDVTRSAGTLTVSLGTSGTTYAITATGSYTFFILAGSGTQTLTLAGDSSFAGTVDNVVVRNVPGNHAYQTTSGARPTLARIPVSGRRNWFQYTEALNNSYWQRTGTTVTENTSETTAPDGTSTASKALISANERQFSGPNQISIFPVGTTVVVSVWAKKGNQSSWPFRVSTTGGSTPFYNTTFDFDAGTFSSTTAGLTPTATAASGGWYRLTFSLTVPTGTTSFLMQWVVYANTPTGVNDYAYFWRPQIETGSSATNYQKVVATTDVTESGFGDLWHLVFDGSDDSLVTNSVDFTATDEMTVIAGVRKLSDAAIGMVAELTASANSNNGSFYLRAPGLNGDPAYWFASAGSTLVQFGSTTFAAPISNVVCGTADISSDTAAIRVNGASVATSANDQGSGNYSNAAIYIGRRGGSSLPFNGHLYQLIIRGKTTPTGKLLEAERFVGRKTGVSF